MCMYQVKYLSPRLTVSNFYEVKYKNLIIAVSIYDKR